jgi:hypothetical protein
MSREKDLQKRQEQKAGEQIMHLVEEHKAQISFSF